MMLTLVRLLLRDGRVYGTEVVRGELPDAILWAPASQDGGECFVQVGTLPIYQQVKTIRARVLLEAKRTDSGLIDPAEGIELEQYRWEPPVKLPDGHAPGPCRACGKVLCDFMFG